MTASSVLCGGTLQQDSAAVLCGSLWKIERGGGLCLMAMMKGCVSFRTGAPITIVPKPPGEHGGGWEYVRLGKDGTFGWFPPAFVRHTDCKGSDSDDEDCASNTCSLGASSAVSLASSVNEHYVFE